MTPSTGTGSAREILRYTQDKSECRKVFFAKYFSASADLDVSAWSADGTAALDRCSHCDNCLRDSTSHKREDKTLEAWQILKIAGEVYRLGGNVTIASLATVAAAGRQSKIRVKRRGDTIDVQVDVDTVAGGKVNMIVADVEILVIQLLVEGYLTVQIQQTKYASYAYLIPSPAASRLTRHAREDLAKCDYSVRCYFPVRVRKNARGKKRAAPVEEKPPQDTAITSETRPLRPSKRKREEADDPEEDEAVIEISSDVAYEDYEILEVGPSSRSQGGRKPLDSGTQEARPNVTKADSEEGIDVHDSDEDVWMYSHRSNPLQRRLTQSPATMADLSDF